MLRCLAVCLLALAVCLAPKVAAAAELPAKEDVAALIKESQDWYLGQQQDDGSFINFEQFKLGVTLLALDALTRGEQLGLAWDHPAVAKGLDFIDQYVQADGSVQHGGFANYTTSLALLIWARSGTQKPEVIEAAQRYLLGIQNVDESTPTYGGIGYGSSGPNHEDLNNTTYAVMALRESGLPADHPALQRALDFVQRCQNLSEVNDQAWAGRGTPEDQGGAVYSPEVSKAGGSFSNEAEAEAAVAEAERTGALRSYGTMTYNLITSYIYLDIQPDDPRIQAALEWCSRNYQFDANPGMPEDQKGQGLFYYYQIMSKTFDTMGITAVPGQDGADWRADWFAVMKEQAIPADSGGVFWLNSAERWGEGIPGITSSYILAGLHRIYDSL